MTQGRRVPPGRSGRLWLRRRLDTAERGRDQLDRKLHILLPERERLRARLDERQEQWRAAYDEAQTWLLRMGLLGGQDAVRVAAPLRLGEVTVLWRSTVGVDYPEDVVVAESRAYGAGGVMEPFLVSTGATLPAVGAFRAALLAGCRAAASQEAVRRLEAEIAVTRQRIRALDKHWLPWLQGELAALELSLQQAEQEDDMRLRRALRRG